MSDTLGLGTDIGEQEHKKGGPSKSGVNVRPKFHLGTTLYVFMILSGYSSLIFETSRVPIPVMVRLVFDLSKKISVFLKIVETGLT